MTNKEAYQLIDSCLACQLIDSCLWYDKDMSETPEAYVEAIRIAKEVFDKQEPMNPVIEQGAPSYYGGTSICRDYYSCPKCGEEVGRGDDKANYCPDCGQKIDWED